MNKKIIGILLILLFIGATIPSTFAADKKYTIDSGEVYLNVLSNGLLHVTETYTYSFDGTYNGVYRDIPLKEGQHIENLNVTTEGAYSTYEIINESGQEKIKVYLYSDEAKTQSIYDTSVNVKLEYDFIDVINIYNDIGELHYKLWGDSWDKSVGHLTAKVTFPSSEGVQYWLNPYSYSSNNGTWDGNTLTLETDKIDKDDYFEIRAAIPLSEFNDPQYANKINENGLAHMKQIQEDYANSAKFNNDLFFAMGILLLVAMLIPVGVYLKFGRDPKITYNGIYERELPTDDSPAFVNSICGSFGKNVGKPDMNGFQATIMDLINRKYLLIANKDPESINTNLKVNPEANLSELKQFELHLINMIREFEYGGIIDFNKMAVDLTSNQVARSFVEQFNLWCDDFKEDYLDKTSLKKYFNKTGATIIRVFGVVELILGAILFIFSLVNNLPNSNFAIVVGMLSIIAGAVLKALPQRSGGRWTEYGEEYVKKWENFKKYLKDFSLIKEHPPESIVIWNKYLVYATAFGVAKEVQKAMEINVYSNGNYYDNDVYMFHYYGGYSVMSSAFNTGMTHGGSNNDSMGGVGGGSGGGGGGAF